MFCTNCGSKIDDGAAFCSQCGARRPGEPASQQARPPQPQPQPHTAPAFGPQTAPAAAAKKSSNTALIVTLAIIGGLVFLSIVAAIAVPNLLTAKEKVSQKDTIRNIANISGALDSYLADYGTVPAADGSIIENDEIVAALSPFYIKVLPTKDAWGNSFLVFCGEACNGRYGLRDCQADDFLVVSLGKGGVSESWTYDPEDEEGGLFHISGFADFERDLVMFNGKWIRRPYGF